MRKLKVLVVDDEINIVKYVRACLQQEGYEVIAARDGQEGLDLAKQMNPALVILDIKMPKLNGFEVCRQLREWSHVPIIMLSALGDEGDKLKCFNAGADDYITKPFGVEELLARVKAVLRRTESVLLNQPTLHWNDIIIDFTAGRTTIGGKEIHLSAIEYTLLSYMVQNAGRVMTPDQILENVWGEEHVGDNHLLQASISRIRRKLKDSGKEPKLIITKFGTGYMFPKLS